MTARPATLVPSRVLLALAVLGVWLAVVPYVGPALGYTLTVPAVVEVVDHVVPGVVIVVAVGAAALARGRPAYPLVLSVVGAVCVLAGLWATSTHLPLVLQARTGGAPWGASVFHSWPGPVILALSAFVLARGLART